MNTWAGREKETNALITEISSRGSTKINPYSKRDLLLDQNIFPAVSLGFAWERLNAGVEILSLPMQVWSS